MSENKILSIIKGRIVQETYVIYILVVENILTLHTLKMSDVGQFSKVPILEGSIYNELIQPNYYFCVTIQQAGEINKNYYQYFYFLTNLAIFTRNLEIRTG